MSLVPAVGPDAPGARKGQFDIQHLHAGIIGADHFGLEQNFFERSIQRLQQMAALGQPTAHGLA